MLTGMCGMQVKKVMLQLFGQILMTPCNPFACNKAYTEFFISHHYLTFLKLYNSDGFDSSTLSLCALHLQVRTLNHPSFLNQERFLCACACACVRVSACAVY